MCGTDGAYDPTQCAVLTVRISLRNVRYCRCVSSYAKRSTDGVYHAAQCYRRSGTRGYGASLLRAFRTATGLSPRP
eukprot:1232282-Rhodomonas_salina.1